MQVLHYQPYDAFHHIMHRHVFCHIAGDLLEHQQLFFRSLLSGAMSFVARHDSIISDVGAYGRPARP